MNDRPTMHDIVNWIDSEALLLIFSMMTIVSILMETGIFDYIAVFTFEVCLFIPDHRFASISVFVFRLQISRGEIWKLISILCVVSATVSMFLDNVVTILLLTPITVKLFEFLELNPVPVLPFIILNVNIAGLTTLIGHPALCRPTKCYISDVCNAYVSRCVHRTGGNQYLFANPR